MPGHDPQQRRLARAVVAEHADLGARQERQRDVLEHRLVRRIDLRQAVHREDVLAEPLAAEDSHAGDDRHQYLSATLRLSVRHPAAESRPSTTRCSAVLGDVQTPAPTTAAAPDELARSWPAACSGSCSTPRRTRARDAAPHDLDRAWVPRTWRSTRRRPRAGDRVHEELGPSRALDAPSELDCSPAPQTPWGCRSSASAAASRRSTSAARRHAAPARQGHRQTELATQPRDGLVRISPGARACRRMMLGDIRATLGFNLGVFHHQAIAAARRGRASSPGRPTARRGDRGRRHASIRHAGSVARPETLGFEHRSAARSSRAAWARYGQDRAGVLPSACAASSSATERSPPSTTSISTCPRAPASACSGPTARASRRR